MQPTIGRIVHYKDKQGNVWPAIVTDYHMPTKELTITIFENLSTVPGTKTKEMSVSPRDAQPGQWWWPERI